MTPYQIIQKPLITEKTTKGNSLNQYGFLVDRRSTKFQVKRALEVMFGVKVIGVNILNLRSVKRRTGKKRLPGMTHSARKALVTLKTGEKISWEKIKNNL